MSFFRVLLAIIFPPLSVIGKGCGSFFIIFLLTLCGWIPGIIGLVEGIMYLTKSDEEFYNTYQAGKKPWF